MDCLGKEETTEKVVARLCGKGVDPLMNDVKVVVNILSCLISDQLLTAAGDRGSSGGCRRD